MEADWQELCAALLPPPALHTHPTIATCIAFDTREELLWAGNEFGRLNSFFGEQLQKYTVFRAHPATEGPVKQILPFDKGILSISAKSVHCSNRRGITQWHLTNEAFENLTCMSFTPKDAHEILVAGLQNSICIINIEKGTISQTFPASAHYSLLKKAGPYVGAAAANGCLHLLNPSKGTVVKEWQAHTGWINDLDARGDYLITCGGGQRLHGGYGPDNMAMVFSVKTLNQVAPIPFPTGAAFVRMHPKMQTTGIIASQTGQLQVVDTMNVNAVNTMKQINLIYDSVLTSIEMSSTGEAMAFTDSNGYVRIWGSMTKFKIVEYSAATEWPPMPHTDTPSMDFSIDTPLSSIGMPAYSQTLLSAWPGHLFFEVGAPAPKIDPNILGRLAKQWAANPKTRRRNQAEDTRAINKLNESVTAPMFLSDKEKARAVAASSGARRKSDTFESIAEKLHGPNIMYAPVDIKYSKFGIDDYDFNYWNDTPFPGLETHIANSYANPLLQLFRFTPLIRNLALQHTASSCLVDTCLLCQLGFLIDMLEKATSPNCHPSNFLKTMREISAFQNLGVLEEHTPAKNLNAMIQSLTRALLIQFTDNFRWNQPSGSGTFKSMDEVLLTKVDEMKRCAICKTDHPKRTDSACQSFVHDLVYPTKSGLRSPARGSRPIPFSNILKSSVEGMPPGRGFCSTCKRYPPIEAHKTILELPQVLVLNAHATSPDAKSLWATPNWLPQEIGIIINQGQFFCFEGEDLKTHLQRAAHQIYEFELIGVVCDVSHIEAHKQHLVSVINVSPSSREPETENRWYLFNDHHVRKVPVDEALRFDPQWKMPSVLMYQLKSKRHQIDDSWKQNLDTSLLFQEWSLKRQEQDPTVFRTLSAATEFPKPGTPVAIDAEFVTLRREEVEVTATGEALTLRPKKQALARVSVLRGDGIDEGIPFIDDYIIVSEHIEDYLTAYSGIFPGDLDPLTSPHSPLPLKVIYKKLWLLLNLGCVFIGHGLIKDFRTINIHVPKDQVVDTVDKYRLPGNKRRLGLKFLSKEVLREDIQTDDTKGHDSIEDARMALRLWRKFQEYDDAGIMDRVLADVYEAGPKTGWGRGVDSDRPGTAAGARMGADGLGALTPERRSRVSTPVGTPRTGTPKRVGAMARDVYGSPLKYMGGGGRGNGEGSGRFGSSDGL